MKKIISLAVIFSLFTSVYSQRPCAWFDIPDPDSLTLDSCRKTFEVHKLRTDQEIEFDGQIDPLWYEFGFDTLKIVHIPDPGQTLDARVSWCYDNEWLNLIIIVAGDDTVDAIGATQQSDLIQLCYQKEFGGAGADSNHYDQADWRKWLWKQDGDRKWAMPSDITQQFQWLDVDEANNGLGTCIETDGDNWLVLELTKDIKYKVNVSSDSLVFEMAFGWQSFLYMDTMPILGYEFGMDISYKDYENNTKRGQINLNDLGNNAFAYAPGLAKFVIADTLISTTGINNDREQYQLKAFPNPAAEHIQIILPPGDNYSLSVIDLTGRKIEQTMIPANTSNYFIDVHGYSSGVYSVILCNEQSLYHTKIIVQ